LDEGRIGGYIRTASTIGGQIRRGDAVRRRGALLGVLTMLRVVMGDGDCGRGGHGDFGGHDGGARFGSDGHGLCAGGGSFGSG
jgi:hypothetical protein